MDITSCSKEELAQAVLELTIELGKTRRALSAAMKSKEYRPPHNIGDPRYVDEQIKLTKARPDKFPALDPMAVDVRSVV